MTTIKALLPAARSSAAILGVTTGVIGMPPQMLPGLSAYIGSKTALVKLLEFVAVENPGIFVASVHPGMVETAMFRKSGGQTEAIPMDTGWHSSYYRTFHLEFPAPSTFDPR